MMMLQSVFTLLKIESGGSAALRLLKLDRYLLSSLISYEMIEAKEWTSSFVTSSIFL